MTAHASPQILIVAQNASSHFGGEAFLPLKYFQILKTRGYPVSLIAHRRNQDNLEEMLSAFSADIHYVEDTIWHRMIWRIGRLFPKRLQDIVFGNLLNQVNEIYQARLIRKLQKAGKVDVIHQPIPVSPLAPSSIHGFGVPVIIGPMNGGMDYPPGYEDFESGLARRMIAVARAAGRMANRLIPGKRRAAALIVSNPRTRGALPFDDHPNVIELVENGVDLSTWSAPERPTRPKDAPLRLVFMGRLVGWKAVDITLQALAKARDNGHAVTLDILGDGVDRAALETQARHLNLDNAVQFLGFRPQAECAQRLADADALILNSVWECGGAVVLEAMSLGLPVIGPDWGGPADYLDDSCGILVHPAPRDDFADRLASAIETLARDPDLRARLGAAGQAKIHAEYDWEKKVDRMLEIYASVLETP